jgi:hypothetical protein
MKLKHKLGALALALGMLGGVIAVVAPQAGAMACSENCSTGYPTTMAKGVASVYGSYGDGSQLFPMTEVPSDKTYALSKGDPVTMYCWWLGPNTNKNGKVTDSGKNLQNKWFAVAAYKVYGKGKNKTTGLVDGFVPAPTVNDSGSALPLCQKPDAYY